MNIKEKNSNIKRKKYIFKVNHELEPLSLKRKPLFKFFLTQTTFKKTEDFLQKTKISLIQNFIYVMSLKLN